MTSTAPATQAAEAPAPPPLLGERQESIAAAGLVGGWVGDTGAGQMRLDFWSTGDFRLDGQRGRYRVRGDQLLLRTGPEEAAYQFVLADDALTIKGGDLKGEIKFLRQTSFLDYVRSWFRADATGVRRKLFRIVTVLAIVLAARLVILFIQGVLSIIVTSKWGPLGLVWRRKQNRAKTLHALFLNVVKYAVYFTALGFVLSELGINYTTYIASLSVVGLAIGFGSQGLVQDMVTGLFVIFEEQFDVGDMVEISGQTGIVTEVGLRSTRLSNYLGQTVIIPNRNIAVVGNFTMGAQVAQIDVAAPGAEAVAKVSAVVERVAREVARQFHGVIIGEPSAPEPVALETGERFVRLRLSIWPQQTWAVEAQLVPRIREALTREGIELPGDRIAVSYHAREERQLIDWRRAIDNLRSRFEHRTDPKSDEKSVEV